MDKISKERFDIWERRLEGGLDGGDVADVLDDWDTDISRYETKIKKLEDALKEIAETDIEFPNDVVKDMQWTAQKALKDNENGNKD